MNRVRKFLKNLKEV